MIRVVIDGYLRREAYVVALRNPIITERTFLKRAGVRPGSYAGQLMHGIYESVFHGSLDFKSDFDRYYQIEYESFGAYLRKRHLLDPADIKEIEREYPSARVILCWRRAPSLLEEGVGEKLLRQILESGGKK